MAEQNKPEEKQIERRSWTSDESGVSHELTIEKHGDDFKISVEPDEDGWTSDLFIPEYVEGESEADQKARHQMFAVYEDAGANPKTDRLVISPREDGGWDLAYRSEKEAREPARVLFEEGSDEHLQIERFWKVLGGATDESLNEEAFGDQEADDGYEHEVRALSVLVHGSKTEKVTVDDLTTIVREIEKMVERLPGDPGPSVRLTRRLEEVMTSMSTKTRG